MGVVIRGYSPGCTDSHLDFFARNLTVCKGDLVASSHGYLGTALRLPDGSPIPDEPLSIAEVKDHLRIAHDEMDEQLHRWIRTARVRVERDTEVALVEGLYRIPVLAYPIFRLPLHLPIWPVRALTAFEYYTAAGTLVTDHAGSPGLFLLDESRPARLALPDRDTDWPRDLREFQPGIVEVLAGYASPDAVPDDLRQAMLVLIEDMNRHRGSTSEETGVVPQDYERWIASWVLPRT